MSRLGLFQLRHKGMRQANYYVPTGYRIGVPCVHHPSSARIFRKYDREKVPFGSNDLRERPVCLVCHSSGYSILIVNGLDYFRNFSVQIYWRRE